MGRGGLYRKGTVTDMSHAATISRKDQEREFHDALRGVHKTDPRLTANKKWYAIGRSNHAFSMERLARACQGRRVLDYCCGDGENGLFAAAHGATEVVGIDISPVSVMDATRKAQERGLAGRVRFEVMDGEAMTFPTGHFDVIIVAGVLHHLDLDAAYRELARVLADDGAVLGGEALCHNLIIRWYRRLTPHLRTAWESEHILGRREILRARRYFDVVRVDRFFHLATLAAVPFRNTPVFPAVLTALEHVDRIVLRLPGIRWQAWQGMFTLTQPKRH